MHICDGHIRKMSYPDKDENDLPLSERRALLRISETRFTGGSDTARPQRPLVEQVSNNWESEKSAYFRNSDDGEDEGPWPNRARDAVASRRFRRIVLVLFLFVGLAFWTWSWYIRPRLEEKWELKEGFLTIGNGTFGLAKGGDFDGTRVQYLDAQLVPGGDADPEGKRRLIFIGDIHGCAHELKKLLRHVKFDERTDHLITVGDVISKGPDNVGVLDELIRLGASGVRGNHEDRILAIAPSFLESRLPPPTADVASNGAAKDAAILRKLSKHHLKYLHDMPLVLSIPALPQARHSSHKRKSPLSEEVLVVHAGLVPAVALEKQDPYFVMNMRSIHTKSHLPLAEASSKKSKSRPWHDIWGWYNDRLFKHKSLKNFRVWDQDETIEESGFSWFDGLWRSKKTISPKPQVVVYGHHSKAGLQITRWSKGLDTGCVRGGELTALVLDAKGKQKIVSVGCKDYRP